MTETYDVLIVGVGSAGAVLANHLSEDGTRRILLLEAGSAYSPNLYPADLANADIVGGPNGHDWGYVGATGIGDRSIRALRGKALGGSSAVNAAVAIRARAADFAKWSALGIQGSCLSFLFMKLLNVRHVEPISILPAWFFPMRDGVQG